MKKANISSAKARKQQGRPRSRQSQEKRPGKVQAQRRNEETRQLPPRAVGEVIQQKNNLDANDRGRLRKDNVSTSGQGIVRPERKMELLRRGPSVRREYRKNADLPDPYKHPSAEINRTKQQVKLRLDPEVIEKIDRAARSEGTTRNAWIEGKLLLHLDKS